MKQWFLGLTQREQMALLIMSAAVLLYVIVFAIMLPLERARDRVAENNRNEAAALQRVDEMVSALRDRRQNRTRSAPTRNLTALLNNGADAAGLSIARLQPNSRGAVQLRFESVPFDALLRWLHSLEVGQGLRLEDVTIRQAGAAGVVSATLTVSAAS